MHGAVPVVRRNPPARDPKSRGRRAPLKQQQQCRLAGIHRDEPRDRVEHAQTEDVAVERGGCLQIVDVERGREYPFDHGVFTGISTRRGVTMLIAIPTTTTTYAPIRLCHRKAMSFVHGENATVSTTAIPAIIPQNAPAAVARFVRIARMKTPRSDP